MVMSLQANGGHQCIRCDFLFNVCLFVCLYRAPDPPPLTGVGVGVGVGANTVYI
jgi:hypothetical protein